MSVTLFEKVRDSEGTRRGRVFRENLGLTTLTPSTVSENEATLRGLISDFFAPAFFDDSVDVFFSYYEIGDKDNATTVPVGTFSSNVKDKVVSAEISGLTRNTAYRYLLYGEIDGVRINSKTRSFRTGAFAIETVEAKDIQQEQATFVGKLAQFQRLVFERSGPFDVISEQNSGLVTFENQQNSESPLFVLDTFTNNNVRTTVNTKDSILKILTSVDSVVSVSSDVDIDIKNDAEYFTFSKESFDFETPISREITSGFEYKKITDNKFKDVIATPPPTQAGDLFEATVSLDPNSDYEFRAFGTIGSFERVRGDLIQFSTLEKEIVDLVTGDAGSISVTEADLNGEVTNIEPSGRQVGVGFRYGVASVDNNTSDLQQVSSPTQYNETISGLEAGTTYAYQTFADGDNGTYVGETKFFQTEALEIETLPQSSSTDSSKEPTEGSAFLFGRINDLNPDSSTANVEFSFGKSEPLTQTIDAGSQPIDSGGFDVGVSDLDAGEDYKYKLIATDPSTGITEQGSIENFTTIDLEVATEEADPIGRTEATLNGFITTLESSGSHDVYFEYREKGDTTFLETPEETLSSQTGFDATITGLGEGTVYEYRAVIEKNTATERGELREFQTDAVEINTLSATEVDAGSATLNGELTFVGSGINDIEVYFYIREQQENALKKISSPQSPVSSTGSFSATIDGLDPNRTYEFQAAADPDIKREQVGSFQTFTTEKLQVETANIPLRRTTTSLLLEGELTVYGGDFSSNDATVGIQYTRAGSGDIENGEKVVSEDSPLTSLQTFETKIERLLEGEKYDVRAFVTVGGTTVFGKMQRVSTKLND